MDYLRRSWAQIDLDAIKANYHELKKQVSAACKTMAIVKADAYGHGDGYVSRALQEEGADWFGVSNINEAVSLRRQGITKPILILGFTPPALAGKLAAQNITQTVYSLDYAQELSKEAVKQQVKVNCHVKVDTGMSRIGFFAQSGHGEQAAREIARTARLPGLSCTGIFTHFSCSDETAVSSREFTRRQFNIFMDTIGRLKNQDILFELHHCCNSAGVICYPQMHLDMVRLGNALYGLDPSDDCKGMIKLVPAMSLYTTVTMVKQVQQGAQVSYGRRYTAQEGEAVASLAIGYADGYRRNLSNKGRVILHGQYAPIIGTVCMDQTMVDVTGIEGVASGDTVTLVGEENGKKVTLDDFAKINGTINYEEACLIGRRVPRVYIQGGKEVAAVDYIIQNF